MASSCRVIASLVLPAAALASECASATTPEGCLTSSACAWLMLPGRCAASDSAEAAASPADCCSSAAASTTCAHSSSELPDGICMLPPTNGTHSYAAFDLSYATRMAHISGAAYCSQDSVASWTCGTHCSTAAGLEMIQYISNEKQVLAGFVAWDPSINAIVVSFRGTVGGITDWVHNLAYTKTNPFDQLPDVSVHHGFWNAWQYLATPTLSAIQSIQRSHNGAKVVLTGHSLGAAIAADAALDMAVNHGLATSVMNFGSPRAGNAGFHTALQQYVPDYFRVTHANDIVPHVPPEAFGFFHAETEVFFPGSDTQYQACSGGEDPSCSDRCAKTLSCISVADHLNYFGVALGGDGCDTPPAPEPMTTMPPTSEPGTTVAPIPTTPPIPAPVTTGAPTSEQQTTLPPTKGQQGECVGGRFHNIDYAMSEELHAETGYPKDFSISVRPDSGFDHLCRSTNGGGTKQGVCVGVNTNDCQQAKGALTIDDFLSCENCFLGLATDISYDLEVKALKPKKVSVGFQNMHLTGAMELLAHEAASKTVAEGSFPIIGEDLNYNIFFMVAGVIPVNINFKVPTELWYQVKLSESTDLRFGGDVDFELGNHSIEWTDDQGWSSPSMEPSVRWTPVLEAQGKVSAGMTIGLTTKLMVELDKVMEYDVSFTPSLPLHADLDLNTSGCDEICLIGDAEFEVDHEASLRFEFFGKKAEIAHWGPAQLYSHHWDKIFQKCWPLPGSDCGESGDDTTMPPTSEPETTVLPTFEPETTVPSTSEPKTTVAPMTTEPVDPTAEPQFSTTSPWEPSEPSDKDCRPCMTMCAPCRECANGSDGSFAYGSCDKCWHCWDWDDDELEDEDDDMDKDCDALHKDHDWDDDEVRCLTNAVTKTGMDCRACWAKIGEMSVFV